MGEKRMYICMCDWVTLLYSRKLTEHGKPAILEKIKNNFKNKMLNKKDYSIKKQDLFFYFLAKHI